MAWDPANKDALLTLSNSNLTSATTTNSHYACAKSTVSKSSGKFHIEFTINAYNALGLGSAYPFNYCLANSSAPLNSGPGDGASNSIAYSDQNQNWYVNGSSIGTISGMGGAAVVNDVIAMEIDIGNQTVWWKHNVGGNWNGNAGNDPATNTGGKSFSAVAGPYFLLIAAYSNSGASVQVTTNFGGSAYAITPSTGFGAWDPAAGAVARLSPMAIT